MDWKLALSTFAAIFIAEFGDKTQLATLSLAAGGNSRLAVLVGAVAALLLSSVLAVVAGAAIARWVPPEVLRRVAGGVFIVLGVLWLTGR